MVRCGADIGVAIAAFNSADVIEACLDSLIASEDASVRVVITDNASTDGTVEIVRSWVSSHRVTFAEIPPGKTADGEPWLILIRAPVNRGFAYATNRALEALMEDSSLDLFWVLNPDCRVRPDTASHYVRAAKAQPYFALMGGRTVFAEHPDIVQTDGGQVSRLTGKCISVNWGKPVSDAAAPSARSLDFITGANCVASRTFIERAGLMREDFFLYYEEVDWAFRRADLPLLFLADATVEHVGGTALGTASIGRAPSAFANYFNYRGRMLFLCRFRRTALPGAILYALGKAVQSLLRGDIAEARAIVAGTIGANAPHNVRERLGENSTSFLNGVDT